MLFWKHYIKSFYFLGLGLGSSGDIPALAKLGSLKRSHSNVPRAASSKKACTGICWMCRAGEEGREVYPFEDTSIRASWTTTLGSITPWDEGPKIIANLPMVPGEKPFFLKPDIWHNFHLGLSKRFLGSSFVSAVERLPSFTDRSVEKRFDFLTTDFLAFCKARKMNPYLKEISRDTLSFASNKMCPVGRWSKGVVATEWMQYLEHFCDRYVVGQTADEVMLTIVIRHH